MGDSASPLITTLYLHSLKGVFSWIERFLKNDRRPLIPKTSAWVEIYVVNQITPTVITMLKPIVKDGREVRRLIFLPEIDDPIFGMNMQVSNGYSRYDLVTGLSRLSTTPIIPTLSYLLKFYLQQQQGEDYFLFTRDAKRNFRGLLWLQYAMAGKAVTTFLENMLHEHSQGIRVENSKLIAVLPNMPTAFSSVLQASAEVLQRSDCLYPASDIQEAIAYLLYGAHIGVR